MSRSENPETTAMLREAMEQPVKARPARPPSRSELKTYADGASKVLTRFSLPHANSLEGMLYIPDGIDRSVNGEIEMVMSRLTVNPRLRRHGVSKRLISALGHVAKQNRAAFLIGQVESQYTIMAMADVFGAENLSYNDIPPGETDSLYLPMTTPEAVSSLERAEKFETDPEHREIGFGFVVDLSRVAMSGLEQPVRN